MKQSRIFVLVLSMAIFHGSSFAQSDDVKAVIKGMFSSMYNADAVGLGNAFHDSARLATVSADGQVRYSSISGFISYVSKLEKGVADERFEITDIRIDGDMASAWVPYKFYRAGAFSHCGVNHILLTRGKVGWKILTITDTRKKEGCQ